MVTASVQSLRSEVELLKKEVQERDRKIEARDKEILALKKDLSQTTFSVQTVLEKEDKVKDLFCYYTALQYTRFAALLCFLVPNNEAIQYESGRGDLQTLSNEDGLFLTLCRLRHNYGLKDLAVRFNLSLQSAGIAFNTWLSNMYGKLGQLPIWPHRDVILRNMPTKYKKDFPTSMVLIDATELKTEVPCALGLQSQMFSAYKSSCTLKGLVGCDPSGSLVFLSELFTGSISDKILTEKSGFYDLLEKLT